MAKQLFTKKMKCVNVQLGESRSTVMLAFDIKQGAPGTGPQGMTPATARNTATVVFDKPQDAAGFTPGKEYTITITE